MTRVTVQLFARYAELLGNREIELALPDDASVADLITAIRNLPGGSVFPAAPLVAVNRNMAGPTDPIRPGDEIAVLPPLAGG